jgi:hypothetical protein
MLEIVPQSPPEVGLGHRLLAHGAESGLRWGCSDPIEKPHASRRVLFVRPFYAKSELRAEKEYENNVYNEELTERIEFQKDEAKTGTPFHGLYFYLASPEALHNTATDDDTSAVILWGDSPEKLLRLLV